MCCCIFVIAPSIVGIIEQARKRHGDSDSNNSHVNGTLGEMPFPSNGTTGLRGSPSNSDDAWGLEEIIGIAAGVTATLVAAGFLAYNKYQQHQNRNGVHSDELYRPMPEHDTEANPNNSSTTSQEQTVDTANEGSNQLRPSDELYQLMLEPDTEANPNNSSTTSQEQTEDAANERSNQKRPSCSDSVSKFFADIKRMCSGEAKSNDQRATEELGIGTGPR